MPGRVRLPENIKINYATTTEEIVKAEEDFFKQGIKSLDLMEQVGVEIIDSLIPLYKNISFNKAVFLIGCGNNGGDGLVVARHQQFHSQIIIYLTASDHYSSEMLFNLSRIKKHIPIKLIGEKIPEKLEKFSQIELVKESELERDLQNSAIYDCLLGNKSLPPLRDNISIFTKKISLLSKPKNSYVISIDLPSGINPDNGKADDLAVAADTTICIESIKRGMTQFPARRCCGEISTISIGIKIQDCSSIIITEGILPKIKKPIDGYKTNSKLLVIAGSKYMPGACNLVCNGAVGAGYIKALLLDEVFNHTLPDHVIRVKTDDNFTNLEEEISNCDALVIGPGIDGLDQSLGHNLVKSTLLHLAKYNKKAVFDAGALNIIASHNLFELTHNIKAAFTPHHGEALRLINKKIDDRFVIIEELANCFKTNSERAVLLKGAGSIVRTATTLLNKDQDINKNFIEITTSPFLATAGSGDVLSGLIGSLLAQGLNPPEALILGVYIHGKAGSKLEPFTPNDLIESFSSLLAKFYNLY